jgi:tetratricopeptide (TPR) repeat protein/tRNA A-37 threonylcarbamoyl transferase component Bud32
MLGEVPDRNLLFGILAVQMNFVSSEQAAEGMQEWLHDKQVPLGRILVDRGALHAVDRALLDQLVDRQVERHTGELSRTIQSTRAAAELCSHLADVSDEEFRQSIQVMRTALETTLASPPSSGTEGNSPLALSAGETIPADSRYRVLRFHAGGGLGRVSIAWDTELNREVAFKEIRTERADDADSQQRFVREAEITGGLDHPAIVPVYGLGRDTNGRPFYTARLIRGESLREVLQRFHDPHNKMPEADRLLAFRDLLARFVHVCQAIDYAHSRGVLHRDIKPSNIMLGKFGETLVVDWGLAKKWGTTSSDEAHLHEPPLTDRRSDVETVAGVALGTPMYMSPEQAEGRLDLLGPATDVYSLGGTLVTILTGKPPVDGASSDEVLSKVRVGDVLSRSASPSVAKPLWAICRKAMARQIHDRYTSAQALANDVSRYLADEPVSALREPLAVRSRRWLRKHPATSAASAIAALLLMIFLAVGLVFVTRRQAEIALRRQQVDQALSRSKSRVLARDLAGAWSEWNYAAGRLGQDRSGQREQVDQLKRDLQLVNELDELRLLRSARDENGKFDYDRALRGYESVFARIGMAFDATPAESLAKRIGDSITGHALLSAVDDYALVCHYKLKRTPEVARRERLQEKRNRLLLVAKMVNSSDSLNARIRDAASWERPGELQALAAKVDTAMMSPHLLLILGELLPESSRESLWRLGQANHPDDFWLNFDLAYLLERKSPHEAAGFYQAAMAIRPDAVMVHNNLGACWYKCGRLDEAEHRLRWALKIDPGLALAYANLGNVLREKGQIDAAIDNYRESIRLGTEPGVARAWNNLGAALEARGQTKEAIDAYRTAARIDPELPETGMNLARILASQHELDEAIAILRGILRLDSSDSRPAVELGTHLITAGRFKEAVETLQATIQTDPQNSRAHAVLGEALAGLKNTSGALEHYLEAVRLDPNSAETCYNLANIYKDNQNHQAAAELYRKAIALKPDFVDAYLNLGVVLKRAGHLESAIENYREAIRLDPDMGDAHYNLGLALRAQKNYSAAEASFRRALDIDSNDFQSHRNLGVTLARLGDHKQAVEHYQQAIRINPDYAEAHFNLGSELANLGRFRASLEHLQKGHALISPNGDGSAAIQQKINELKRLVELEAKLPQWLAGEVASIDAADRKALANLCVQKGYYLTAARLFAEDLATDRQQASFAGVLAGCGRASDGSELDESAKKQWRMKALTWLRELLSNCIETLQYGSDDETRSQIRQMIEQWQRCEPLSVVREANELTKLSADEQLAWSNFWDDVRLLSRHLSTTD